MKTDRMKEEMDDFDVIAHPSEDDLLINYNTHQSMHSDGLNTNKQNAIKDAQVLPSMLSTSILATFINKSPIIFLLLFNAFVTICTVCIYRTGTHEL